MSISRSRDLRLLAGAAGISALGDFMAIFPLVLHVQQQTGSAFAVSALIFALWGPVVLAAGVAGAVVDRFENRGILIVVSLGHAAVAIRARRRPDQGEEAQATGRAREGFAFLVRERDMAITLGGAVAALAVFSISATAEPFFVTDSLRAGSLAYGVLLTSWTLGMAAGSAGLAHRVGRAQLAAGALTAVVLQGSGIA